MKALGMQSRHPGDLDERAVWYEKLGRGRIGNLGLREHGRGEQHGAKQRGQRDAS
jgi:hypothetical protein